MAVERVGLMELGGKPVTIIGADVQVGQTAPEFTVQAGVWPGKNPFDTVNALAETAGKVRIIATVPSLDTSVCATETRKFNQEAANLGADIVIITVSADLPVTQKRWCGAEGVDKVLVVSDHLDMTVGEQYGTWMKERRWHRRAVFVVGKDNTITYADYMPKLGDEPNYAAVLEAARHALTA